jgi:hypothetical protein
MIFNGRVYCLLVAGFMFHADILYTYFLCALVTSRLRVKKLIQFYFTQRGKVAKPQRD